MQYTDSELMNKERFIKVRIMAGEAGGWQCGVKQESRQVCIKTAQESKLIMHSSEWPENVIDHTG